MEWQLIESDAALKSALAEATDSSVVAVDTEFMRRNTFYPQVALVQLCFGEKALLVDPLTITDTSPLAELLTDPGVIKVLHSASEDLEVFSRWLGVLPEPLFDSQRAAALLDLGFGMGYSALVKQICSVDLPKGETRSDWLQRPLTESQCEYAAQDVAWLLPVWRHLQGLCSEQGKEGWVLADGRDAVATYNAAGNDYLKRMKTAWKLDARQLATLMAVCSWREDTARRRDKDRRIGTNQYAEDHGERKSAQHFTTQEVERQQCEQSCHRRQHRSRQGVIDRHIQQLSNWFLLIFSQILPYSVVNHHRIVQRVTNNCEDGSNGRQREFQL